MCHEFDFDSEAEQIMATCKAKKSSFASEQEFNAALPAMIELEVRKILCPIGIECTVNDEHFEIAEETRKQLEDYHVEYAVNWIFDWYF